MAYAFIASWNRHGDIYFVDGTFSSAGNLLSWKIFAEGEYLYSPFLLPDFLNN